jgi:hypothetical protein
MAMEEKVQIQFWYLKNMTKVNHVDVTKNKLNTHTQ